MCGKLLRNSNHLYIAQCVLFLAVLSFGFALGSPFFFSLDNLAAILNASAIIGLLAIGGTFVIASGGIDLSSAAVLALSSCVCATLLQKTQLPVPAVLVATLATGAACGFLTGFFINVTKAPSIIVTLGMMSIVRAAAYIMTDGAPVYGLPDAVIETGQGLWNGIPVPILVLVGGLALAHLLLAKTKFGVRTLILGDNEAASLAMGIPTEWMRIKIFTLAGLYSGAAGLIFAIRTNAGDPAAGLGYELIAITAIILGGASLYGGRATIFGTTLGILCLGVLQNGLNLLGVSSYYQILFVGIVLLAAAFLSRFARRT